MKCTDNREQRQEATTSDGNVVTLLLIDYFFLPFFSNTDQRKVHLPTGYFSHYCQMSGKGPIFFFTFRLQWTDVSSFSLNWLQQQHRIFDALTKIRFSTIVCTDMKMNGRRHAGNRHHELPALIITVRVTNTTRTAHTEQHIRPFRSLLTLITSFEKNAEHTNPATDDHLFSVARLIIYYYCWCCCEHETHFINDFYVSLSTIHHSFCCFSRLFNFLLINFNWLINFVKFLPIKMIDESISTCDERKTRKKKAQPKCRTDEHTQKKTNEPTTWSQHSIQEQRTNNNKMWSEKRVRNTIAHTTNSNLLQRTSTAHCTHRFCAHSGTIVACRSAHSWTHCRAYVYRKIVSRLRESPKPASAVPLLVPSSQ